MNDFIYLEMRKLEGEANFALHRIRSSKTIRELVAGMHVQIPPVLRSLKSLCPELKTVEREAGQRAEMIVRKQLQDLSMERDEDAFLRRRAQLLQDWRQLGGNFPRLVHTTHLELERMRKRFASISN